MSALVAAVWFVGLAIAPSRAEAGCRAASPAFAPQEQGNSIEGTVSTLGGTVLLPGVDVEVFDHEGRLREHVATDAAGHFAVPRLEAGTYRVRGALNGFKASETTVTIAAGAPRQKPVQVRLDLPFNDVEEHVDVRPERAVVSMGVTIAPAGFISPSTLQNAAITGQTLDTVLQLLPGVVRGPDGVNIKGGRATQSTQQVGTLSFTDMAFGTPFRVPVTAVESIEVLPNPYAVEFGRFSSGVSVIETRRGGDRWEDSILGLEPAFRLRRGSIASIQGIEWFAPRALVSGPLRPEKAWLTLSGQFRYGATEVRSRPQSDLIHRQDYSGFARLDLKPAKDHSLTLTGLVSPEKRDNVGLDTFTGPDATYEVHQTYVGGSVAERTILSDSTFLDSAVQVALFTARTGSSHPAAMVILPTAVVNSYFDTEDRRVPSVQWVETMSGYRRGRSGEHLFKAGLDLLHGSLSGTTVAEPVEIRRLSGTLGERIVFDPIASQDVAATDVAAFVQDRWRPFSALVVETGIRMDHDGVLLRTNLSPRAGVAISPGPGDRLVLRGGLGLFYERTPLGVGAFDQFEARTMTRFAEDGVTPIGSPVRLVPTMAAGLDTPHGLTGDVSGEWRVRPSVTLRAHYLSRLGRNDLLAEPREAAGQLVLDASGRSRYREAVVGAHWRHGTNGELDVSYVRSSAWNDYNAVVSYIGTGRQPIVRPNAYGPSASDVPHRLVAWGHMEVGSKWRLSGNVEARSGMPYSAVDELQQFVGARNQAGRFPAIFNVDAFIERRLRVLSWHPWIGISVENALSWDMPNDVQRNLSAPGYGTFSNSLARRIRLTLRVAR